MFTSVSSFTAATALLVTRTLAENPRPKIAALRIMTRVRGIVAGATAFLSHAHREKRLWASLVTKARRDALQRQEEETMIAALRSQVLGGMNERMVRFKGLESSERIALLPGNGGIGKGAHEHDVHRPTPPWTTHAPRED